MVSSVERSPAHQIGAPHQAGRRGHTGTVRTADGVELACYRWPAASAAATAASREPRPRATVALLHGLAEHAGRYAPLAECLNAAGIELVAIDLRGHGRSPGKRTWVARIDDYLSDAQALLDAAGDPERSDGSEPPLFLMGHSMGGAIAALFAVERLADFGERNGPLAGLILSSPALAPGRDLPRWKIAASRFISRVWPSFPAMKVEPALLARDETVVEANRRDSLVHHGNIPARTGAGILDAMARIERGRAALRLPVLVYHGSEDELTEPQGSRAFAAQVGSPDCTLTIYEGSYHETMNDLDRERVIEALIDWIKHRSSASSASASR
ncbi:lysophospholipase [Trinickia sp. EG282A]|uniref:lysophospholipase n=1 Tax=Trinickia sp. EG282A TaxID=3237013 RepID=UPI0034D31086